MFTQEALKGDLFSYPKSWISSASPSDLLHRSEGSWALIFSSRDSALPIRAPLVYEAPARCCGKRKRWALQLLTLSSEREASCGCESPTSKEVKLGYPSH